MHEINQTTIEDRRARLFQGFKLQETVPVSPPSATLPVELNYLSGGKNTRAPAMNKSIYVRPPEFEKPPASDRPGVGKTNMESIPYVPIYELPSARGWGLSAPVHHKLHQIGGNSGEYGSLPHFGDLDSRPPSVLNVVSLRPAPGKQDKAKKPPVTGNVKPRAERTMAPLDRESRDGGSSLDYDFRFSPIDGKQIAYKIFIRIEKDENYGKIAVVDAKRQAAECTEDMKRLPEAYVARSLFMLSDELKALEIKRVRYQNPTPQMESAVIMGAIGWSKGKDGSFSFPIDSLRHVTSRQVSDTALA